MSCRGRGACLWVAPSRRSMALGAHLIGEPSAIVVGEAAVADTGRRNDLKCGGGTLPGSVCRGRVACGWGRISFRRFIGRKDSAPGKWADPHGDKLQMDPPFGAPLAGLRSGSPATRCWPWQLIVQASNSSASRDMLPRFGDCSAVGQYDDVISLHCDFSFKSVPRRHPSRKRRSMCPTQSGCTSNTVIHQ